MNRRYYSKQGNLLDLLPDYRFRHFRFSTSRGYFFKVPEKIRSADQLRSWIISKGGRDIYYSVAIFRHPERVGTKGVDDAGFMGMDLAFDIDSKNLGAALESTREILSVGADRSWVLKYVAFSGSKGFHVIYHDPFEYRTLDIEKEARNYRADLVDDMYGIDFDTKITLDTRRIIRLPYSIHPKTGLVCTPLDYETVMNKSIEDIKSTIKHVRTLKIPRKRPGLRRKRSKKLRLREPAYFYSTYLSNRVIPTDLFVTIIEYRRFGPREKVLLEEVSRNYRLGRFYVFRTERVYCLNFKPVQADRLDKILCFARSENLHRFKERRVVDAEIGPREDTEKRVVLKMKKIGEFGMDAQTRLSKGHYSLFFDPYIPGHYVGNDQVEMRYKIIELK